MTRNIGGFTFQRLGTLRLKRDSAGRILEYVHQLPSGVKPNRHSSGPFCTFDLPEASRAAGVYAFMIGDEIKYIGECEDLQRRFGSVGYGHIAARNCHSDGQATNCKINALVLKASKADHTVNIWFLPSADYKLIESRLISELAPPWNGARPTGLGRGRKAPAVPVSNPPTTMSRFEPALQAEFRAAERSGRRSVRIRSGDLHRLVGGYPGPSHKMPACCTAIKSAMRAGDLIITSPPKGAGASLVIEYQLPRGAAV